MTMVYKLISYSQNVVILAGMDKLPIGDDSDALLPKVVTGCETIEDVARREASIRRREKQKLANDSRARIVNKIPIIGITGMGEIEIDNLIPTSGMGSHGLITFGDCVVHLIDKEQEASQANLVERGDEQFVYLRKRNLPTRAPHDHTCLRDAKPNELVALGILPLTCLEKTLKYNALLVIAHGAERLLYVCGRNHCLYKPFSTKVTYQSEKKFNIIVPFLTKFVREKGT